MKFYSTLFSKIPLLFFSKQLFESYFPLKKGLTLFNATSLLAWGFFGVLSFFIFVWLFSVGCLPAHTFRVRNIALKEEAISHDEFPFLFFPSAGLTGPRKDAFPFSVPTEKKQLLQHCCFSFGFRYWSV